MGDGKRGIPRSDGDLQSNGCAGVRQGEPAGGHLSAEHGGADARFVAEEQVVLRDESIAEQAVFGIEKGEAVGLKGKGMGFAEFDFEALKEDGRLLAGFHTVGCGVPVVEDGGEPAGNNREQQA